MATPKSSKLHPSFDGQTPLGYDPQAMEMEHDSVFAELVPGVANSGNMAYKYGAEGDHSVMEVPPTGLKGD